MSHTIAGAGARGEAVVIFEASRDALGAGGGKA